MVKRYVPEIGSGWVAANCNSAGGNIVYISVITQIEVLAGLVRRNRGGGLSSADLTKALAQLQADVRTEYRLLDITTSVVQRAMNVIPVHALRGYDALQLATCLEVNKVQLAMAHPAVTMICADTELIAAAAAEGLTVDDPNAHP